jgi:nucleoside-diphosphate-sugar epimerase
LATALHAKICASREARLIFASSVAVAGLRADYISNFTSPKPDSPYGKSKALAECCIEASGVNAKILRIGGVFGLNGPNHLGINRAITEALASVRPFIHGDGLGERNYIFENYFASIMCNVLQKRELGTHNVAGIETLSIDKMIRSVCEAFDIDSSSLRKAGESSRSQIIDSSAVFSGKTSFRESLGSIKRDAIC